ncbi:hypothetical protein [Pseudaminobacter soli (ex Li et al. 2025)]|uniref:hypothetical protein n=1 Tax=Pseudaminobacter soli (ex Li et al. 2025) TaxID=1295366 RepID=UPI0011B20BC6|nr:hypothetical protein [Mesorhizobium soli]
MSSARASDMLIAIWSFCEPEDREAFVSYLVTTGVAIAAFNSPETATKSEGVEEGCASSSPCPDSAEHFNTVASAPAESASDEISAIISPDPHLPLGATAVQEHQVPKLSGAKSDVPHVVGQGCATQVRHFGHSGHEDASAAQAGNEAGSASEATVTNSKINPHCQRPASCSLAHSLASCSSCANAAMKKRIA